MEGSNVLQYHSGRMIANLKNTQNILVKDVSFSIAKGESLALIGETGSGKTMIALSIMGLLPENIYQEQDCTNICGELLNTPKFRRKLLGKETVYIPQNGMEFLNPTRKIRHQFYDSLRKLGIPKRQMESEAIKKMILAGLDEPDKILDLYPFQLSGGMAQRVTIALAAGSEARLVIADEPTNGLDEAGKNRFLQLLKQVFPQAGRLIITHDLSVAKLCDRVFVLCGGRAMEAGNFMETGPRSPYTCALLGALVENGMQETPLLRSGEGECPFYRRCASAIDLCRSERIHHTDGSDEWWCCNP